MDIRVIVFGMCFVLIGLFVAAKFFVPREKEKSLKEAQYAERVFAFRSNPSEETYKECLNFAKSLPRFQNQSEDLIKETLKKDQVFLA